METGKVVILVIGGLAIAGAATFLIHKHLTNKTLSGGAAKTADSSGDSGSGGGAGNGSGGGSGVGSGQSSNAYSDLPAYSSLGNILQGKPRVITLPTGGTVVHDPTGLSEEGTSASVVTSPGYGVPLPPKIGGTVPRPRPTGMASGRYAKR
jgi:hypothetical protein